MFLVPTCIPIATDATTNASQPKTAVFQWLALQRPMRAAMLFERFKGDICVGSFEWGWTEPRSDGSRPTQGRPAYRGAAFRTRSFASRLAEPARAGHRESPGGDPERALTTAAERRGRRARAGGLSASR